MGYRWHEATTFLYGAYRDSAAKFKRHRGPSRPIKGWKVNNDTGGGGNLVATRLPKRYNPGGTQKRRPAKAWTGTANE